MIYTLPNTRVGKCQICLRVVYLHDGKPYDADYSTKSDDAYHDHICRLPDISHMRCRIIRDSKPRPTYSYQIESEKNL